MAMTYAGYTEANEWVFKESIYKRRDVEAVIQKLESGYRAYLADEAISAAKIKTVTEAKARLMKINPAEILDPILKDTITVLQGGK